MTGFDRLKIMLDEWLNENKNDEAFKQTVNYLLDRDDLEQKFLNEEKTLKGLNDFIQERGRKHLLNGWCYITNEVVFAWAVMYFSLPNSFLKIKEKTNNTNNKTIKKEITKKDNIISLETVKEKKKEIEQLSMFGGVAQ